MDAVDATPTVLSSTSRIVVLIFVKVPSTVKEPPMLTLALKVASVDVMILSVDATPVRPVPSPTKLVAVTTPAKEALPFVFPIVTAVPTENSDAVTMPEKAAFPLANIVDAVPIVPRPIFPTNVETPATDI